MALPHTILCVDDEKNILNVLKRLLRNENYGLLTASSGHEALNLMEKNPVHLVIADQRMPEMSGTELFEKIKEKHPDVIRIVLTGYTEIDTITNAINKGNIYKCFLKPWDDEALKLEIRKALDHYDLIQLNRELNQKITCQNEELKKMNDTLEQKVKERTHDLEIRNQALELSRVIMDQLPYPVIGVDNEGFIVIVNQKASHLSGDNGRIFIGDHVSSFFNYSLDNNVLAAIENQNPVFEPGMVICGNLYRVDVAPLTGRFKNKGVVVVLSLR